MMESPSKYSVEQLLKARQDGVPDYIVVPMIQKAMAEKQASQNQQAMQQGAQKPPTVAQQVLSSAAQTMNKEKQLEGMPDIPTEDYSVTPKGTGKHPMADVQEEMGEEPEQMAAGGIAALRSGLPNEYAGGGIIAFANGTDEEGVHTTEAEDDYLELISPNADALRKSNATAGYSVRDPKTGEMTNKHWKSMKDSLVAEHNLVSKHNGEPLDQFYRTYYGHDKPKDKQDEYVKQLTEFTGLSPDTVINKDDPKLVKRVTGGLARKEQGYENLDEAAQDAILSGKPYRVKSRDGQSPAKEAPKGIASLVQPQAASPLDLSELENLKSTSEDRDINAQMAKAEKLYGTNPDYERRAKSYDEQETKLKGDDDKAMWKALMHAGIGMMSGKSPNFMSNLASGVTAGAEDYEKTREDIDAKKAHLAQLRDALGDARRQERLAVAKYGADSVQASKASDKALALEAARLKASRGEKELSAEVQGQANAIRAAEIPSTIAMHEGAAENYRSDAEKNRLAASPEMKLKEELKALEDHMHNQIAIINSSNATDDQKAQANAELAAYSKRHSELSKIPISTATTSVTPESKGYLPTLTPYRAKLMDMYTQITQ